MNSPECTRGRSTKQISRIWICDFHGVKGSVVMVELSLSLPQSVMLVWMKEKSRRIREKQCSFSQPPSPNANEDDGQERHQYDPEDRGVRWTVYNALENLRPAWNSAAEMTQQKLAHIAINLKGIRMWNGCGRQPGRLVDYAES